MSPLGAMHFSLFGQPKLEEVKSMAKKQHNRENHDRPKHPFKRIALCVNAIMTWIAGFGGAWKLMDPKIFTPKVDLLDIALMMIIGLSLLVHVSLDTTKKFRDFSL